RRYVDAMQIPYVVGSPASLGAQFGDVVAVYNARADRLAFAVLGDCCTLGEASIRLHRDLGHDPIVVGADGVSRAKQGISDRIVFIAFANTRPQPTLDS